MQRLTCTSHADHGVAVLLHRPLMIPVDDGVILGGVTEQGMGVVRQRLSSVSRVHVDRTTHTLMRGYCDGSHGTSAKFSAAVAPIDLLGVRYQRRVPQSCRLYRGARRRGDFTEEIGTAFRGDLKDHRLPSTRATR